MEKTLLLVDDEEPICKAIQRLCRKEGYNIFLAASAEEALEILQRQPIAVILSDQRLPGITGIQLFSEVKKLYPDTLRLMISGYTALESIAGAINDGAIFKFIFKPWDDEQLLSSLREAFSIYELKQQNRELTTELKALNSDLEKRVEEKTRELMLHVKSLNVSREILDCLPYIAIGVSEDDFIVGANELSKEVLCNPTLVGSITQQALPADLYGDFCTWRNNLSNTDGLTVSNRQQYVTDSGRFMAFFSVIGSRDEINGYLICGEAL